MPPLSREAFAAALARRSRAEVAAFVAAVERAREHDARVDDGTVVVDDGTGERRLWVHDRGRLNRRRLRPPPAAADADAVVTPLRDPPGDPGCPVVDADDLRDVALYGVPPSARDALLATHLGHEPGSSPERSRRWTVLSLVVLLLVAAAVGAAAVDVGTPPGDTLDSGPSATPTPGPDEQRYPPGLSRAGVSEPGALGRAHEAALANRSFTVNASRTVRTANGTLRSGLAVTVALGPDRSFLATAETAGPDAPVFLGDPPARGTYWSNGTTYARRLARDDERLYNTFEPAGYAGTWRYWTETVPFGGTRAGPGETFTRLFAATETRVVTTREPDGVTRHFVSGDRAAGTYGVGTDARDVRLEASVTPDGLVRSFALSYAATVDGAPVRVAWRIRYTAVGRTSVAAPPWLDRALRGERVARTDTASETPWSAVRQSAPYTSSNSSA